MALGSTQYTSVTWTTGDTITETKLDNMVANDQAYDSHAAQGILLNNNVGYYQKDSGGTNRELINLNSSDIISTGYSGAKHAPTWMIDGWIAPGQTWTYASSSTFTISGDFTSYLAVGDKIKLTQTTVKYFVVTAVSYGAPNTTVTVKAGDDYTLANAAITSPFYSKMASPNGWPTNFNYVVPLSVSGGTTPTYTAADTGFFYTLGRTCILQFDKRNSSGGTAGSGANAITGTLPIACSETGGEKTRGNSQFYNNTTGDNGAVTASGTTFTVTKSTTANVSGNDQNNVTRQFKGLVIYGF